MPLPYGFLILFSILIPQDTTGVGALVGHVSNADGSAAAFATVCATGTSRCTLSDAQGAFRLDDLRAGEYRLEIAVPDRATVISDPVDVRAGLDRTLAITLPAAERLSESVTVTGTAVSTPVEVKNSGFLVSSAAVDKSAGALQDVSRYIQTLPGVVIGGDDFRNDIIVRGGSPLENLFVVDNVEVPNINTFANFASAGGSASILDSLMIGEVTFLTGGYPASYINRASSVLQVTEREGRRDRVGGIATVGFNGAGAIVEGPLGGGKGSWIVSARRSFLDLFTTDVGIGGVPVQYSVNAKLVYDLGPRDRIWAVNLTGVDRIRLGLTESSDLDKELSNFDIRYSGWRAATGFNWQRIFGTRGVGLLGVTHSESRLTSSVKDLVKNGVPPPDVPPEQVIAQAPIVYSDTSREGETTVKYDATVYAPAIGKVQAGGSLKAFGVSYDTAAPYGYDSPYSATPGRDPFSIERDFRTTQTGAYAQATTAVGARTSVTWGGRFDRYGFIGQSRVSPRLSANYRVTDKATINGSYGIYYQQPAFLFLSVFPRNQALVPFRADHYVAGVSYQATSTLKMSVEGYRKNYRDYPVAVEYPSLSLANLGDTFNVQEVLFPLVSAGVGHAEGIEFYAEQRIGDRWYGQTNLAWSRTRHAGLDGVLRPGAFDYPVVFNLVGGWQANRRWAVSTRVAYLSGRPYTPFDVALSESQRRGIYDLTQVNAARAPAYFRLDLRVDRTFTVRGEPLVVFAGVQNATNRRNFAQYTWNRRSNAPYYTEQLGVFPLVGLQWRF